MPLVSFRAHIGSRTLTAASWEVDNETALDKLIARLLGPLERTFELAAVTVFVDDTESPVREGTSISKEDLPLIMVGELVSIGSHVVLSGKSSGKQLRASSMTRQSIKMFTTTLSPSTSNAQVQTRKLAAGVSAATQAAPTLRSAAVGTPKVRTANTGTDVLSVTVVDRGSQCAARAVHVAPIPRSEVIKCERAGCKL